MSLVNHPSHGPSLPSELLLPLRGEAFSAEHLDVHFRSLAESQVLDSISQSTGRGFSARFEANAVQIAVAHQVVTQAARGGDYLPSEAEWLLDNYYVVEEQLREIRDDLPRGFYEELPKTTAGDPRVYELARELVIHTDSSLDGQMIERCVREFQSASTLSIGEVWAIPIMLRLVLVENLRRLCDQMLLTFRCRHCAHEMLDAWRPDRGFHIADETEPHCIPTIIQLVEQLPGRGPTYRQAVSILERQVTEKGWQLPELVRQEHQRQAANQVSIGNVITSMRLIANLDWSLFFEQVNIAEQILRRDPANVYPRMHFETRDDYRHVVEELAKRTKLPDTEIASVAIALAQANQLDNTTANPRQSHVGYWLIDQGRRQLERRIGYRTPPSRMLRHFILRWPLLSYFGCLGLFTVLGVFSVLWLADYFEASRGIALLLGLVWLLPASELAQSLNNLFLTNVLPPRILPRFDFKDGVPLDYPTIIVVPSMLSHPHEVDSLLHRLESHYLSNSDEALLFALLTDFTDADTEVTSHDAALLEQAIVGIRQLNARYATDTRRPFYLFHRKRQWNQAESVWMGWERKRGKLMEFGRLLQGEQDTSYVVREGELEALKRFHNSEYTPFVITLDSDTHLPHDVARKLIGTLAHPLNRPQFGADRTTVTAGYTILQPRVNVHLESAGRTWFSKIFAGSPGVDPYSTAASDVYQDLFAEASFTGKGIYDLQAFERALAGAFPENAILSHDLIEGCHARVGLVSNIEVYDGYPARYDAEARRTHRWVRGDWQLLPWLLPRVPYASGWKRNPLSLLSRWKVTDNLRRSLVAPALLVGLIIGWFCIPRGAIYWSLAALLVLMFPLLAQLSMVVRHWPWKFNFFEHVRAVTFDVVKTAIQCSLAAVVLPHKAWAMIDAIGRTLLRMGITRRHLLEWETAAAVERRVSSSRWHLVKELWILPASAILLGLTLPWVALPAALPFLLVWFIGPLVVFAINRPLRHDQSVITASQQNWLRQFVSETWSFFEAYVGPDDHWLPVDNIQEEPQEKIAHRLSPTNEGLFLISALIARDFGYVGLHRLASLWENNLQGLAQLEQLKGHFYNWYDTETLAPLAPRYVSTVDSGNLAACLLTLHEGIEELTQQPAIPKHGMQGLVETLQLLNRACDEYSAVDLQQYREQCDAIRRAVASLTANIKSADVPRSDSSSPPLLAQWAQALTHVRSFLAAIPVELNLKSKNDRVRRLAKKLLLVRERLESHCEDFEGLYGWVLLVQNDTRFQGLLAAPLSLKKISTLDDSWHEYVTNPSDTAAINGRIKSINGDAVLLQDAFNRAALKAKQLLQRFDSVAARVESMALSMDFRFLFNEQRQLFSIGFNVDEGRLDRSHYDMLCSEARLASYLAIAKGDVAASHWFRLGRHATITERKFALLSWGGTMFEYLMPPLFHRQFDGSLLTQSCRAAVQRQQEYGRQNKIPWGISESAYGALAVNSDYHYRSFGVPGLGLKRGLARDLVVSPYSTLMALPIDPAGAVANLQSLIEAGAHGFWGFYDALDFTPERVPVNKRRIVVRCYMAHHQGMGMLGLANLLDQGSIQRRFNTHPLARAAELLLQERVPTVMTPYEPHADEVESVAQLADVQPLTSRRLTGVESAVPKTHLLSNGTYSVMLTSAGGGFSRSGPIDVTRWRSDTTVDGWGQFLYFRDLDTDQIASPTYQPTCVAPDQYEVIFAIDKVDFHRVQGDLESVLEVAVSPENNAEVRQLRVTNHSSQSKRLQVTSYAEVSLATAAADIAHPAFQKLFVETEFIKEEAAIVARRRPRDAEQPASYAVHVLAIANDFATDIQYDTSRQTFIGRRRSVRNPQAIEQTQLAATTGAVLDPIFSLRCTLTIPPGSRWQLHLRRRWQVVATKRWR